MARISVPGVAVGRRSPVRCAMTAEDQRLRLRTELVEKRKYPREPVTLLVEYDGADDFVGDYTDNLSQGGTFVSTERLLPAETSVRLVLSFPGLLEPIAINGIVRWTRVGDDAGVGIEFAEGPQRLRLAEVVERIKASDPATVARLVRVLVVEDNPHVAKLIYTGLRASSKHFGDDLAFNIYTVTNGREALDALRAGSYDAVIVDIYLPVLDGTQLIAHARNELGLRDLPIIAVSAGGDAARKAAVAAGADMFIEKPMRLRQVIETIRALMKLG